jgi:hypothetical protein
VAGLVRVLAAFVLGHQAQYPQRAAGRPGSEVFQRLQGREPSGALAGQARQLVDAVQGHRAQHREQSAHRLANSSAADKVTNLAVGRATGAAQPSPWHTAIMD